MKKDMIWAYFLQLSTHMWDDENSPARWWYLPPNYTETNDVDFETWDKIVDFLAERKFNMVVVDVGDAIRYRSHPEISAPDAVTPEFLRTKLDEMRARGIEPIPKLNFSACHMTWLKEYRRMLSTPTYYQVCADLIAEVCEIFDHPRLFHLGWDEENYQNQTYREAVHIRGEKLLWKDAHFLFAECEKNGARPWIWGDYVWHHKDLFAKYVPKSVLISNWIYAHFRDLPADSYDAIGIHAYEVLNEMGYEQVPTSSTWENDRNTLQTMYHCREKLDPKLLCGFMTASWKMTTAAAEYSLKNDAHRFYLARKEVFPESFQ